MPPFSFCGSIVSGGQPFVVFTFAPSLFSASARGFMGLSRIRLSPSIITFLPERVASAVRNLVVVPAFPV